MEMYAFLSKEALRWTRPPYNEENIRKLYKDRILYSLPSMEIGSLDIICFICTNTLLVRAYKL
jgi:hypothetical protein